MDRSKFYRASFADEVFARYIDELTAKMEDLKKQADEEENLYEASKKINRALGIGDAISEAISWRRALQNMMEEENRKLREELGVS